MLISGIAPIAAIDIQVPIPQTVTRIVFSGGLPLGEEWSTGFFIEASGASDPASLAALAQSVATKFYDGAGAGGMFEVLTKLNNAQMSWIKTSAYSYPGGGTKSAAVGEYVWTVPKTGGMNNGLPSQCAVVASLRTAHPGRSYRGRMFLPCTGASLQIDGQLQTTVANDLAVNFAGSFSALGNAGAGKAVVVSPKLNAYTQISSVVVDTKVDTMRSRNKSNSVDGRTQAPVT